MLSVKQRWRFRWWGFGFGLPVPTFLLNRSSQGAKIGKIVVQNDDHSPFLAKKEKKYRNHHQWERHTLVEIVIKLLIEGCSQARGWLGGWPHQSVPQGTQTRCKKTARNEDPFPKSFAHLRAVLTEGSSIKTLTWTKFCTVPSLRQQSKIG